MPTCLKCAKSFPSTFNNGGVVRSIGLRKYCLSCSPFRTRHKRNLDVTQEAACGDTVCFCTVCDREYIYNKRRGSKHRFNGHSRTKCNSCLVNARRFEGKLKLVVAFGGRCSICGYNKSLAGLHFHHVDAATKKFQLAGNHARLFSSLMEEAKKCILICANCHAENHQSGELKRIWQKYLGNNGL